MARLTHTGKIADPICIYNVDGGKVLPCDPLKRSVKRTVTTKPKGKR